MALHHWVSTISALFEEAVKEQPDEGKLIELFTDVCQESPVKAKAWSKSYQDTCPDCSELKRDIANLKTEFSSMKAAWRSEKAAAAIRQIALNIEHWVKQMVVEHVGAEELGFYDERLHSIDEDAIRSIRLSSLLTLSYKVIGKAEYFRLEKQIFPSGLQVFERTIYNMKRFSDLAHPLTYEGKDIDENVAKGLVSSMLPCKEGEKEALEDCKEEGKRLIERYARSRPSGSAFLQKI